RVIHPLKPQEVTCLKRSSSSLLIQFASFRQVFKKIGFEITNEILYLGEPLSECVGMRYIGKSQRGADRDVRTLAGSPQRIPSRVVPPARLGRAEYLGWVALQPGPPF